MTLAQEIIENAKQVIKVRRVLCCLDLAVEPVNRRNVWWHSKQNWVIQRRPLTLMGRPGQA